MIARNEGRTCLAHARDAFSDGLRIAR
jgi:hypothetical protein